MPETPPLTPPPEEPLPDTTRAQIRQRLGAATQTTQQRPGHRWLVPGLAAAAVLTVVAGAFAVASTNDDNPAGNGSLQPAGPETTLAPTPTPGGDDTATPSDMPLSSAIPTPDIESRTPIDRATPSAPTVTTVATPRVSGATSCADEVSEYAAMVEPALQGASVTAQRDSGAGTTYLYETKSAWVVCDDSTAVPGGPQSEKGYTPTLLASHLRSQDYKPTLKTLAVSTNFIGSADYSSTESGYIFAAGRDFDGVQAISYAFPDGHTEQAVVGENGLWSMSYVITDPPTVKLYSDLTQLDPIDVTVTSTSGTTAHYTLEWGVDGCGQVNHGC